MPLSAAQEKKIEELRQGITDAPTSVVANNKACLLELFVAIDELKKDAAKKADSLDSFKV